MDILDFPLVRFTLFFVAGIVWADWCKPEMQVLLVTTIVSTIGLAACFFRAKGSKSSFPFGLFIGLTATCCGVLTQSTHAYYNQHNHYIHTIQTESKTNIQLTIHSRLKNSATGPRYVADVTELAGQKTHGKILVYFHGQKHLPIGTMIIASSQIVLHPKPLNPNQFDYGKYLRNKSIPARLFLHDSDHRIVGINKNIAFYTGHFRDNLIAALRKDGFAERELQVLHALILGQQQEIAPDIVKDYQFAGAVHILSVSGLHVGFVLLFVNFILKPLPKTKRWNFLRLSTTLLSLWMFALVAGLSPSVVRSATMFSFVAIGMNLRRSTNTFHTLIVSLLLILLFEPSFLFDVGFQLSYAALFFIVWLQPMFLELWQPKWRVVKYFWEIITVSFAAQIGTLPLSLYYFHQFPALFFVTNIVVIPMLSVIMALGLVVMLPAALDCILPLLPQILEWGIATMNRIISRIASFEAFVLTDIPCNTAMLIVGYAAILSVFMWFKKPTAQRLVAAAFAILIFQAAISVSIWYNRKQSEWIVLNVPKSTSIIGRYGREAAVYGENSAACGIYATAHFAAIKKRPSLRNTFWFDGKTILLLNHKRMPYNLKPDVVVLSGSPKINLDRWLEHHRPVAVVADASNYKDDIVRWKATCKKRKIPFHDTREKGFFKLSD